jgi:allantoicase
MTNDFTELTDLAAERTGGLVLGANDEFFAPKENLLLAAKPVWKEGEYTDRGKWMDGWESRRRRTPGHDWCVVKLGLPGVIRGVVVDTAFFRGNYPDHCSIEATAAPTAARFEELTDDKTAWTEILPKAALKGDSLNRFAVKSSQRWTHLRFHIYPDGGVARLRVHGEVSPQWDVVSAPGVEMDLAALENGGLVVAASDDFFGHRASLIAPGRGVNMGDGWETRRRRGPGHDWCVVKLGVGGVIKRLELDTNHFKGNYPDMASVDGWNAPEGADEDGANQTQAWSSVLPKVKLQAHTRHLFVSELDQRGPFTHLRLNIYPDGGVSRMRVWGTPSAEGRTALGLARLESMGPAEAEAALLQCCGSSKWAKAMLTKRPFTSHKAMEDAALGVFLTLEKKDWLEAFTAHPRIGDKAALREKAKGWEAGEQKGATGASDATLDALLAGNREYEKKFGHIFIVCATGKSADEMLANLNSRLANAAPKELEIASGEQRQITKLRIAKLLGA